MLKKYKLPIILGPLSFAILLSVSAFSMVNNTTTPILCSVTHAHIGINVYDDLNNNFFIFQPKKWSTIKRGIVIYIPEMSSESDAEKKYFSNAKITITGKDVINCHFKKGVGEKTLIDNISYHYDLDPEYNAVHITMHIPYSEGHTAYLHLYALPAPRHQSRPMLIVAHAVKHPPFSLSQSLSE